MIPTSDEESNNPEQDSDETKKNDENTKE